MSTYRNLENYITGALSDSAVACGHWAGNGAVAELEGKLCSYYGARHALCVDSATNALLYLLLATGLKRGEIMTSPLSFGGTIAGALALGCSFCFADVDESLCISPESIRGLLGARPRTKAVIAVDYAGIPHQMEAVHGICREHGLWHFVDAAQSMGAGYDRRDVASLCDAMVVSFGGGKAVFSGGEGGAIITDNPELYGRLLSVCQHAHRQERDLGIGLSHEFALNGRMHPIAALLACGHFESGLSDIRKRRRICLRALTVLSSFESVSSTLRQQGSSFYHCPFIVNDCRRFEEEFRRSCLADRFFFTAASVTPLPEQLCQAGLRRRITAADCPGLDRIIDEVYFLHINPQNHGQI